MARLSLRLTHLEKDILQAYAKSHGISMAQALKDAFFDQFEDQEDAKAGELAYQAYLKDPQTISMEEMKARYGF